MDILLVNRSAFNLPTSQRAGAIVYGGTRDLSLWRPPGPDRDLLEVYGERLADVLDGERRHLGGPLSPGDVLRLHAGRLRCDFLIWAALSQPHGDLEPAAAPDPDVVERAVHNALRLAARHSVSRVAFGALGRGRGERPASERLVTVVRAARGYLDRCFADARPPGVEEVLVCDADVAAIAHAKRAVARLTKEAPRPQASAPRTTRRPAADRRPRRRRAGRGLSSEELAEGRAKASRYDRTRTYASGDWVLHPTFGVGRVEDVLLEQMVTVLFEDGEQRKMIHGRRST